MAISGRRPSRLSLEDPRYEDAIAFVPPTVDGLIRNAAVKPHWIGDAGLFWYERQGASGREFIRIDPATRSRVTLEERPDTPPPPPPGWLVSPDGRLAIFRVGENIRLRELASGAERMLTADGIVDRAYGLLPGSNVLALSARLSGASLPPHGTIWSPDSRRVILRRADERDVTPYPFLEFSPKGQVRPVVHTLRRPLLGDTVLPRIEHFVVDVDSGAGRAIDIPEGLAIFLGYGACWWDETTETLFTVAQDGGYRRACLLAIDLASGRSRIVIEEHAATHHDYNLEPYRCPNVHVLKGAREAIWFSQRDGWGHLYLYDLGTGEVRRQVTQGAWAVFDVLHIDEDRRRVLFTAGGREAGHSPYHRHLYRAGLDGGEPVLLTPEDADHGFRAAPRPQEAYLLIRERPEPLISPRGDFCIDIRSTVTEPPVTTLRSTKTGEILMELEKADVSALTALGYQPPERFVEKAADGETDIYGLINYPPGYDPACSYPVIEAMVVAPHQPAVPHHFTGAVWDWNPPGPFALSRLGFIVIRLDGRGTTHRDKVFHDFTYGAFETGLIDHVAVLRRLGQRIPAMDLSRIGAYGYSLGGYFAARALLEYRDTYKAAVAIGGSYHFEGQPPGFLQKRQGPVPGGTIPEDYRALDCRCLAAKMQGQLLLVTGDLDDVAPPALAMQFAEALIAAGKDVEMLMMPGRDHIRLPTDPYVLRRMWDFFLRHLC